MNTHDLPTRSRGESVKAIVRVVSGNFLEMYDFMVYGYYASAIAHAYFPAKSQYASLLLTLLAFAAGFVMRPVGAVVLGAYIDHHGRRKGLILTLLLMAIGTLLVAAVPGYDRIGVLVTSNRFRPPAMLAKIAATVDVVSNGRLEFGIGAGSRPGHPIARREYEAHGLPFHDFTHSVEALNEACTVIRRLWAEGIAKLALVYFISLFGFVIWIGLVISWLFFQGVTPPLKS